MTKIFSKRFLGLGLTLLTLAACGTSTYYAHEVADRLAAPAWMIERTIPAGPFALTAFERMHERHAKATVYIEGDGPVFAADGVENNPTPLNPVALHLATRDRAQNVVYLARPCQYSGLLDKAANCQDRFGPETRFSAAVINAYDAALDDIKRRYNIDGFHLVGYGGGGAIAAVLGAQRGDVVSLRTVAANLDPVTHAATTQQSLSPSEFVAHLGRLPQIHFIGGQDAQVPPAILHGYLQDLGPTPCVQYDFIQEAAHDEGWVDKWPELLKQAPTCRGPLPAAAPLPAYEPEPVYHVTPEVPEKK